MSFSWFWNLSEYFRTSQAPRLGLVWSIFRRFLSLLCRGWSRGSHGSHGRGSRRSWRLRWSLWGFRFLGEFRQSARSRSYGLRKAQKWAGLRCKGRFQELNYLRGSVFLSLVVSFVSLLITYWSKLESCFICALCEVLLSKVAVAHLPCIRSMYSVCKRSKEFQRFLWRARFPAVSPYWKDQWSGCVCEGYRNVTIRD